MPATPVRFALLDRMFGAEEQVLARHAGLTATAFRYSSGVAALRLAHSGGHITVLPFHGQQIWDATFQGRPLTMRSTFPEPRDTSDYMSNYGGFFLHCGMTAMGNPGPRDTHPLHGELPNARFDTAELVVGDEGGNAFMELTGASRQTRGFRHDYIARPRIRLYDGASVVEAEIAVENLRNAPLEIIYLGHANFRPADGGRLVDTVKDDKRDSILRRRDGDHPAADSFRGRVFADVAAHRTLPAGPQIDPEIVISLRAAADADGWAHALQVHPDGTADLVSHRPEQLPYAVRWMVRNGDEDALGFVLPATAPPDGLAATQEAGLMVKVPARGAWAAQMRFGAIDAAETKRVSEAIERVKAI